MYIHVHTYMDCIHTHPYIYTCIYVCIYMYGCIYICVCVCIYICTCIAGPAAGQPPTIHGLASAEGGMHVHIQTYTYTRIHPYTPTYMLCSVLQWVVAVATHRAQLAVIRMPRPVRPNARYIYSLAGWQASCSTNYCILHMAKSDSYNIHNYIALYACCVLHTLFYIQTTCLMECKVVTTCSHGSASFHSVCWTYQVVSK